MKVKEMEHKEEKVRGAEREAKNTRTPEIQDNI